MKKLLSVILSAILVFTLVPFGVFAAGKCTCGKDPIIMVNGLGNTIYQGDRVVFPPQKDTIVNAVKQAIPMTPAIIGGKLSDTQLEKFLEVAETFFAPIAFDVNGDPINGVGARFSYPTDENHKEGDFIYFDYDWRVDPFVTAAQLKDFIDYVKELTGHDSVYLAGESMGTIMMNTYLATYGFEGINGVVWYNGAYNCVATCSDSYANKNKFEAEALGRFLAQTGVNTGNQFLNDLFAALTESGLLETVFNSVTDIADDLEKSGRFSRFLNETIGTMPGFWAMVSSENFDDAVEFVFPTPELKEKYAGLIERITRYHDEVGSQVDNIMAEAQQITGKVGVVAGYGSVLAPVTADNLQQSDGVIGTAAESNGATCAPYGSCFAENYTQAVDCGHNHISADREIDASTCFFPENTWFVKYGKHNLGSYGKTICNRIFFSDGFNVFSDPTLPQFLLRDEATGAVSPLTVENGADIQAKTTFTSKILSFFFRITERFISLFKALRGMIIK